MSNYYCNNTIDSNYAEIDNGSTNIVNNILKNATNNVDKDVDLTHRDCITLYLNPNIGSKKKFNIALEHVKHCKACKEELNKISNNETKENFVVQKQIEPVTTNNDYEKAMQNEKNLQYQNILIQNTISKYFDSIEEKKKLNDNIDKIFGILNTNNIIQQNKTSSTLSVEMILLICIGIIIILLLIVDIVLRFKQ